MNFPAPLPLAKLCLLCGSAPTACIFCLEFQRIIERFGLQGTFKGSLVHLIGVEVDQLALGSGRESTEASILSMVEVTLLSC